MMLPVLRDRSDNVDLLLEYNPKVVRVQMSISYSCRSYARLTVLPPSAQERLVTRIS